MSDLLAEEIRLVEEHERSKNWKRFGPYLAERQWATVREDYSPNGDAWNYFTHEMARSRAYRWGEDGLLGITDRECRLAFALALWNGEDPILKERLFGLTAQEGNHGEDVKECYFYLDSTPTHSYMKALYKYPQTPFPYDNLVKVNKERSLMQPEYELEESGAFAQNRYFDLFVEYAKASPDDILIRIEIVNRSDKEALCHLLPTLWFRNTWSWTERTAKPQLFAVDETHVVAEHPTLGRFHFNFPKSQEVLFTENETNTDKLYAIANSSPYVKDGFHDYVIAKKTQAVNPAKRGTKCAPHYRLNFNAHETKRIELRLTCDHEATEAPFGNEFQKVFQQRQQEADAFFAKKITANLPLEEQAVARQAYSGLLWNKQFYYYVIADWLKGDPYQPQPPPGRNRGRNGDWIHFFARDVISMPDKWEYPWFASWDLAFQMVALAKVDPFFAKQQLLLLLREWYMHPSGMLPAYEFAFADVNPPVHAWGAWRVYKMTGKKGERDRLFLERIFQKLLLNFTWWVNRKDLGGNHLFSGGFLGLDNIGIFNRSQMAALVGMHLEQADATAWMGFYCLTLMAIALELSEENPAYEDLASKFFEHFIHISDSTNQIGGKGLWSERDGFYYDHLKSDHTSEPLATRSLVGLIPLIAVEVLDENYLSQFSGFMKRMHWFLEHRSDLGGSISLCDKIKDAKKMLLAIPSRQRLERLLSVMLDEKEFLSPYGIRSLSKIHEKAPYHLTLHAKSYEINYVPGESTSQLYGGNSNWRGPIWFPINFLIIEALERYYHFYGESFRIECPTGSGRMCTLNEVAKELTSRLTALFIPDAAGLYPYRGANPLYLDPHWHSYHCFHEYFHGEHGKGLGASHQTGWTALIARLLEERVR